MPPLFSLYVFLALSFSTGSAWFYLIISVIFASVIQGISLLRYVRTSKKDANVENRDDRPALFAIAIISYTLGYVTLRSLGAPFIFNGLMFAYVCNTTLATVITKYLTKVSVHTWGIAGPFGRHLVRSWSRSFRSGRSCCLDCWKYKSKVGISQFGAGRSIFSYRCSIYMAHSVHNTGLGSDDLQILAE